MKPELLVLKPLLPGQMEQLDSQFVLHHVYQTPEPASLIESVGARIRGVVTSGASGVGQDMLARLPALEIVASSGVGTDSIDIPACQARGVPVTNTPDVLNDDVADTGIALILGAMRQLVQGHAYARDGSWARKGPMPLTRSVRGKTLGIVGLGRIGKELAERASALKMKIAYTGRKPQDTPYEFVADLHELARRADVLALTCPGGAATRHLINASVLEALGAQSWLVNLARGSVVDEAALIAALRQGTIGGAALDVFENEPHIDPAFSTLENVLLYPHHASGTVETRNAMSQLVVDNLLAHFGGKPLVTPVR
jgi:lactate dehydrogenase-like 2-hydroxyacid dehydrogenase